MNLRKFVVSVLALALFLPYFNLTNLIQEARAGGDYPPADFGVDWSSTTVGGEPKINLYWAPPADINKYVNPGLGKETAKLSWVLNVTDTSESPPNHFVDSWKDGYSKLEFQYVSTSRGHGVIWGHSYTAHLDLREESGTNIGFADLTFTLPATGAGGSGSTTVSGCAVQSIAYKVELWGGEQKNGTIIHFSWKEPVVGPNCIESVKNDVSGIKITRQDGSQLVGALVQDGKIDDPSPVAGIYTFTSKTSDGKEVGVATISVSLAGGGTSVTTPGTGSGGTGGTGGTPGSGGGGDGEDCGCPKPLGSTFLGMFVDPICGVMCAFITAMVDLAAQIIDWFPQAVQAYQNEKGLPPTQIGYLRY